jgi:cytochrome c-type biogenesis protein CcmH
MRRALWFAFVATLAVSRAFAIDPTELSDPQLQARYQVLIHELRCMQCQNESIADSPVDLAGDLRRQVRDMLVAGKTDDEIKQYMVDRYSDFILFKPRFSVKTAWLWAAPFVLLLIGAFIAFRVVRQRSTLVASDNDPVDDVMEESAPPR